MAGGAGVKAESSSQLTDCLLAMRCEHDEHLKRVRLQTLEAAARIQPPRLGGNLDQRPEISLIQLGPVSVVAMT